MLGPVTQAYADLVATLSAGPREIKLMAGDGTYAEIISGVAVTRATDAMPAPRLAWLLAGICARESAFGTAKDLDGPGPGCTGDFTARLATPHRQGDRYVILDDLPAHWRTPRGDDGDTIPGPYAIPADLRGWGRSEWQHDYGAHPEVTDIRDADGSPAWRRTRWACDMAAQRFLADLATLGKERLALAAYNCGVTGVRRALDEGKSIDWNTTGRNYSGWILGQIGAWGAAA